jgi:hypothetical protein
MNETEVDRVVAVLASLLPRRRRIHTLVDALTPRLGPYTRPPLLSVAQGLLVHLRVDPHAIPLYLTIGARLWDGEQLAAVIADLSQRNLLYLEVLETLHTAVRASVHASLLDLRLGGHADPRIRRLGLTALVAAAAPKDGWTTERRARLDVYMADRSPEVAGPASFVWPP